MCIRRDYSRDGTLFMAGLSYLALTTLPSGLMVTPFLPRPRQREFAIHGIVLGRLLGPCDRRAWELLADRGAHGFGQAFRQVAETPME